MLFTTAAFVYAFLPTALLGFFWLGRRSARAAAAWLLAASVFFYGYWMPVFTLLLLASIGINFGIGQRIAQSRSREATSRAARLWLIAGVIFNLSLLAYFKYFNFFVDNLASLLGSSLDVPRVVLPIGISFYSFTQIAYLVDAAQGRAREPSWIHYGLFVTYFPHLIAGPVLHHGQMMPQFADRSIYRFNPSNAAAGAAIFALGLFKKVVLADGVSPYADAVFGPTDTGLQPTALEAWLAALAYTLQLYFDFSGYSDMAIGLSWMFNIRLPFNFDSPYRASNISDFWRRWHISLSNFLRDYLYIALGGNRLGTVRRYANLLVTMILGGLWHGAGWSFLLWGTLHGLYLVANHGFRAAMPAAWRPKLAASALYRSAAWVATMLAVIVAWVPFRAETIEGGWRVLRAMAGVGPTDVPHAMLWNAGLSWSIGAVWCGVLALIALAPTNSNEIGTRLRAFVARQPATPAYVGGFAFAAIALLVLVNTARDAVSAFIYFNF